MPYLLQENNQAALCIANGIDFGHFRRIPQLIEPNLHEQLIISQFRLFQVILKVVPNFKFQQNHTMNSVRANAILFLQDAPEKVLDLIQLSVSDGDIQGLHVR